jgi:DNA-binding CsgD family transcriptional regulator
MNSGNRLESYSGLVEQIYSAVAVRDKWQTVMVMLANVLGGGTASLIPLDDDDDTWRVSSAQDPTMARLYYERWWKLCPIRPLMPIDQPSDIGFLDDSFLSDTQIAQHPYYRDYLRPLGVGRRHYAFLRPVPGRSFCLAVTRPIEALPETAEQMKLRRLLTSHVKLALALSLLVERTRQSHDGFEAIFLASRYGAAVLDSHGHVLTVNPALERVSGDGIVVSKGRLAASLSAEQPALSGFLATIRSRIPGKRTASLVRLTRPSGRAPLIVRAIPLASLQPRKRAISTSSNMLILVAADDIDADVEPLLRHLGLSPSEARLARRISNGESPEHAAAVLKITIGTARQVLKAVFAKLEVRSQSQLARTVHSLEAISHRGPEQIEFGP